MEEFVMDRIEKAVENYKNGYNCAQAVLCAYSDLLGMDEALAYGMAEAFGTGIGGMQGTCGAVLAMYMAVGLKNSDGLPAGRATRGETYKIVRELNQKFKAKNGSTICKELRGSPGQTRLRSCPGCVEDAAGLLEEWLRTKKDV